MTASTSTATATRAPRAATPPRLPRLVRAHTRALVLDLVRTPVAIVSTTVFPTLAFLFFVLPQGEVTKDATASLAVAAQLGVFGVMSAYLFGYGIGVAEERANPWSVYLRTLPAGAVPTTVARFVTAAVSATLSLLPLVLAIALLTDAPSAFTSGALSWGRIPLTVAVIVVAALPFLGLGLAIGYSMSSKAAVAVAQVLNFPLAFVGGLMLPPQMFPDWLDVVSLGTPSRAARDCVAAALTGGSMPPSTLPVLAAWTVAMLALAVWANRRDEGRRFR